SRGGATWGGCRTARSSGVARQLAAWSAGGGHAMSDPEAPAEGGEGAGRPPLRPDMTVRQVAADYPGCREVLRRHGEPEGRRGGFGHPEPLAHFARRRGIDPDRLLAELAGAAGVGVDREAPRAEVAHRPFIAWALAVTLTLGAGWGGLLLFEIGRHGEFD